MIVWNDLSNAARVAVLQRPAPIEYPERRSDVARFIAQIRADGDASARALTRRFDGVEIGDLCVSEAEFAACEAELTNELKAAMRAAFARIKAFHAACAPAAVALETAPGVLCERIIVAIDRVGLYVPAGSAPLPSTALMLGVPAMLAGCAQVVLCSPPDSQGHVHPTVLYAAKLCGIQTVVKLGGVQAIAAMAFGTQSVPKCDKIFGPGNAWVTEAKQQVSLSAEGAAIDMPAGPSEVLVIADRSANAEIVAADLLSQAEHGPDSQVILLSDDAQQIDQVKAAVARQLATLARADVAAQSIANSRFVLVSDIETAIAVSNQYAPEHLLLNVENARQYLAQVRNAGSIFLGALTPESTGDYNAGTNHVLPTYGHARAYSGVSLSSFLKLITVQTLSAQGLAAIGPEAVIFARAEGLEAHALAVQKRLDLLSANAPVVPTAKGAVASVLSLVRPEFLGFKGYSSARMEASVGATFLNANESPWPPFAPAVDLTSSDSDALNRYPAPQPHALRNRLAEIYGVRSDMLLIGRGSDELIDLLTRAFCRAGLDRVLIMPPTFGMYKVCATVQGAQVLEVPLLAAQNFAPDWHAATRSLNAGVKLAYVCTPNNPTGGAVNQNDLIAFINAAQGRAVVVVDEAYFEFSDTKPASDLIAEYPNVVVLRTLSKAYGLAGARVGCAIARPEVIALLRTLMAPYPVPSPVAQAALRGLADLAQVASRIAMIKSERLRLASALSALTGVVKIWPSVANFLTFELADAKATYLELAARGVVLRDVSHYPGLAQNLRVSVGTPTENEQFLQALREALADQNSVALKEQA
jgi:histidinol dehydrogenase